MHLALLTQMLHPSAYVRDCAAILGSTSVIDHQPR